jgi:hypothetical protein
VVFHQPVHAVEAAAFLVGGQREDQIAIRREPFLLQPNQVGDELRRHPFVVSGPAAVEIAVLLEKRERIERPVLALGLHDVEMRQEEERLASAGASEPRDEVALARIGTEHLHVSRRESRGLQPRRHRVGSRRRVANRIGRVDLDQLFEDVARPRVVRS